MEGHIRGGTFWLRLSDKSMSADEGVMMARRGRVEKGSAGEYVNTVGQPASGHGGKVESGNGFRNGRRKRLTGTG